ncbi:MAG: hypothetical protein WBQ17_01590 [Rhizomicrobium sp.]
MAIALLLCIHIAAIALLLSERNPEAPLPRTVREIILSFPTFHPKPVSVQRARTKRPITTRSNVSSIFKLPPALAMPATQPDLSGVGHTLFGCDPAAMLNPDQRAGCGAFAATPAPEEVGMPKKSHVVQAARWANELAIKHSRKLVPCLSYYRGWQPLGYAKVNQGVMVDMICVGKGLLNGFGESK